MTDKVLRTVAPDGAGVRLDVWLAGQPEVRARSRAKRMIEKGAVQVAGQRVRPGLALAVGQVVAFDLIEDPDADPLAPDLPLPQIRQLYDDPSMCAIDKPVGLAAHPPEERRVVAHTVASWARATFGPLPTVPDAERPGIVHRLDRDTSGVMLLAKTPAALEFLRQQFRDRQAHKEYRCLVYGEPRFHSDWIERAIAVDPRHPERMTVVGDGGRESATFYEVLERFDGFAYVRCLPRTGRTHQIRVHMTSIGHSLVGDKVYRSRRRQHDALPAGAPDPGRQCLHAFRLEIAHPDTHEPLAIEAPLPDDMLRLIAWLREHRPARS
jgi:23S rRNA pseudouridine1911/1915/1917 synthase